MPSAAPLGRRTIVFIDEIHRFNKAQQDAFLPYVERGDIILIGATTENPSFEVIAALLSRSRVYALRALTVPRDRGCCSARWRIASAGWASAARRNCWSRSPSTPMATRARRTTRWKPRWPHRRRTNWRKQAVQDAIQRKVLLYDKSGEEHYNLISALHKSVRSSDVDAALYWLARMLEAGEDRLYIARRLMRMAIEDIGLADPRALEQASRRCRRSTFWGFRKATWRWRRRRFTCRWRPSRTRRIARWARCEADVQATMAEPVPMHLRNAVRRR
jgi:putative ATPase